MDASDKQFPSLLDFAWLIGGEVLLYFVLSQTLLFFPTKFSHLSAIFLFILMLMYIYIWVLLIMNKRRLIGIFSWLALALILTMPYIVLNDFSQLSLSELLATRSAVYAIGIAFLSSYAFYHVIIHGIAAFVKKKRPVLTKHGLINFVLVIVLLGFLNTFAISFLNIFYGFM